MRTVSSLLSFLAFFVFGGLFGTILTADVSGEIMAAFAAIVFVSAVGAAPRSFALALLSLIAGMMILSTLPLIGVLAISALWGLCVFAAKRFAPINAAVRP